jgi:hypothetical protein
LCDKPGWGLWQEEYGHQEYHGEDDSHSCQCAPVQPLQQKMYLEKGNVNKLYLRYIKHLLFTDLAGGVDENSAQHVECVEAGIECRPPFWR